MDSANIIWFDKPTLVRPYVIMAFQGWANAGEVPSSVMWYMVSHLGASLFAELKPEEFYIYQTTGSENKRPLVNIENGVIQSYSVITMNFWYRQGGPTGHDIILAAGPEPERGWEKFSQLLLDLAQEYEAEKIVALGGTFDAIPHTVDPLITGVVSQSDLQDELKHYGIGLTSYKGPSSIHTLLMVQAARRNLPMISLWSHTPHYIQVVDFMSCYKLMSRIRDILGLDLDLEVARRDSEYLYAQIDEAVEKKPELQEYLRTLEIEYQKEKRDNGEPINKNIIKEIEDLFRDKQG
jgi:proteasome assembly chaperone (PAC2) family protein